MRYRLMATYRGVPYEAGVGPYGSDVVLFAACPPPEELGFEPATGHWRKRVIRAEVDALWESRPVGIFNDEPCIVLDDLGDRLHIAYLGADADRARTLGYWQVDRGVFELLTAREEVTGLTEERVDKPLLATQPPAAGLDSTYPYHSAPLPPPVAPPPLAPPLASLPLAPSATSPSLASPVASPSLAPSVASPSLAPSVASLPLAPPLASPPPLAPPVASPPLAPPLASPPLAPPAAPPALDDPLGDTGGRAARRQRVTTRDIFSELADLAAIPRTAYALEYEADGALCLVSGPGGFEVFVAMNGVRHEARSFSDEEAAYFYLFGVLAAEAVRNGTLSPAAAPAGLQHDLS